MQNYYEILYEFFWCFQSQITNMMSSSSIFSCLMTMISYFMILFITIIRANSFFAYITNFLFFIRLIFFIIYFSSYLIIFIACSFKSLQNLSIQYLPQILPHFTAYFSLNQMNIVKQRIIRDVCMYFFFLYKVYCYILIFYCLHQAVLLNSNHDHYILFHVFQVQFLYYKSENSLSK